MKTVGFLILLIALISSVLLIQGCSQSPTPNFQQMILPKTKAYYLVCPAKYCNVTPNEISPVFPVSADDLYNAFNQMVSHESRIKFTYTMPEQGQFQLVQKSFIFGFPDDIAVQFIALSDNTSTLAIFSKSRYGYYDFGVNKRRVTEWLEQLKEMTRSLNVTANAANLPTN